MAVDYTTQTSAGIGDAGDLLQPALGRLREVLEPFEFSAENLDRVFSFPAFARIIAAQAWATYRAAVGEQTWDRLEVYEAELELRAPARPYWYLGVLATHPSFHNQGLASALLAHTFAIADEAHLACWLETEEPEIVRFEVDGIAAGNVTRVVEMLSSAEGKPGAFCQWGNGRTVRTLRWRLIERRDRSDPIAPRSARWGSSLGPGKKILLRLFRSL